ncbi:glutathione S-transferase C-terminal domain-containing protein [Alisedimentitalea sp. MJ-SS2]|uniref:glutathione S-transferase C-terminal domain-containing protein n=1 Tax=Aliisedimentitalea sp. MJ-SS2 TaxID=3049795 RepID=UPI002913862E|nr:glutathione S-transferase C-terminal domain-containing protein [Alisedimentitalea sp. MJ-SS2]MDU8927354.1 glutathione S-transferase C-terminal domain-containing protein [Alisedimentitalea sp. MJ-SS2]
MSDLTVFTYPPAWGLPSACPFAVKLLAWLNLHRIPYRQIVHSSVENSPTGNSPWVEVNGEAVGETDAIIAFLANQYDIPCGHRPDESQHETTQRLKTAFEDQFHKVMEYEMLIHPVGVPGFEAVVAGQPSAIASVQKNKLRHRLRKYLDDCGFTAFGQEKIEACGRAKLDKLSELVEQYRFIGGEHPSIADLSVFGQVAPLRYWPMRTPVAEYVKSSAVLRRWCDSIYELCRL